MSRQEVTKDSNGRRAGWSFKVARIAGIDVRIHATFFILLAWLGYEAWSRHGTLIAGIAEVGFVLALFLCVVLHEYGHALVARRFGCATRDITVLPIGGVARLERLPERPSHELLVAIAGPAVNFVIAGALGGYLVVFRPDQLQPDGTAEVLSLSFPLRLFLVNVLLGVFNLVPAFPMDGGRVLRALLAMRMDYARATNIAARVGQGLALLLGLLGLQSNLMLVLIAVFIWFGASAEAAAVRTKSMLVGIPVGAAMFRDFAVLQPDDPLERAAGLLLSGSQKDFPVVEGRQLVGLLQSTDLIAGLRVGAPATPVREVMTTDLVTVTPEQALDDALGKAQESELRSLPVVRGPELVGLLTVENVHELIAIRGALLAEQKAGGAPAPAP
jgi:Zn-dependent protease